MSAPLPFSVSIPAEQRSAIGERLAGVDRAGLQIGLQRIARMRKLVGGEGFEPPTNCV